ncbi:UNVERIFIED_CONTAM: hypothetical protein FKN15_035667 [Acipenser sinensis]
MHFLLLDLGQNLSTHILSWVAATLVNPDNMVDQIKVEKSEAKAIDLEKKLDTELTARHELHAELKKKESDFEMHVKDLNSEKEAVILEKQNKETENKQLQSKIDNLQEEINKLSLELQDAKTKIITMPVPIAPEELSETSFWTKVKEDKFENNELFAKLTLAFSAQTKCVSFLVARRGRCVSVDCLPTMAEQNHGGYQLSGNPIHGQVYLNNSTNRRRKEKEKIKYNNKTTNKSVIPAVASRTARISVLLYRLSCLFLHNNQGLPKCSPLSLSLSVRSLLSPRWFSLSRPALPAHQRV